MRNIHGRLGKRYSAVRPVVLAQEQDIEKAYERGDLSVSDWDDIMRLDFAATGRPRTSPTTTQVLLVLEVSVVVDRGDVERVHRRAEILRRLGLQVEACVDGESILSDAKVLAEQLGVVMLVSKEAA